MGYVVLAASILMQVCLGSVYAWTLFAKALAKEHGLAQAQTQLIFGVTIAVFTISMIFAGRVQSRYGPAPVAFTGGLLFGGGYLLASYSGGGFLLLLLGIGVIGGAGIGFGYVCPLATCVQWFPQRKGFVSGLAVAGFGGGAVLLSSVASIFFAQGWTVLEVFRWVGLCYGGVILVAALLLRNPPGAADATAVPEAGEPQLQVLRDRAFWRLASGMLCGTFTGLMVVGNLEQIGEASRVPPLFAVAAISSFAIGNALGRITWGVLADKFGAHTIPASLLILAGVAALLVPAFPAGWPFVLLAGSTWRRP